MILITTHFAGLTWTSKVPKDGPWTPDSGIEGIDVGPLLCAGPPPTIRGTDPKRGSLWNQVKFGERETLRDLEPQ